MDRTQLLQHFETLANTPGAPAKLRNFVLSLAVRGQLLPQKAAEEKHARWQEFAAKFAHHDSQEADEPPFLTPKSWRWVRLNDVADYRAADKVAPSGIKDDDWVLDLEEIEKDTSRVLRIARFAEKQSTSTKAKFLADDVLYGKLRPYLNKVVVAPQQGFCTTEIVPIRSRGITEPAYLGLYLRSPDFVSYANSKSYGMKMPRLGTEDAESAWIAVPPPAEQRRIVAKVEELLALCDELEARQSATREHRTRLVRSALDYVTTRSGSSRRESALTETKTAKSLSGLTSAATRKEDDFQRHAAFVLREFPQLTTAPEDIPALRQAILSLAVQGRLVPQNTMDEPASKILATIRSDVAAAVRTKRMKARKNLSRINESNLPFSLPPGWEWTQLGELTAAESNAMLDGPFGSNLKTSHYVSTPGYAVIRLGNLGVGKFVWGKEGYITKEHYDSLSTNHVAPGDLIIAGLAEPLGRCCEVPKELGPAVNKSDCFRFRPHGSICRQYIVCYMNSPIGRELAEDSNHGMTRSRINSMDAKALPVSLPPLAEQQRIVAKLDELMRWCDALAARLAAAQTTATHLLDATLRRILHRTFKGEL